jgi:glycosyltransferase involved in cell wall biosynthesis
VELSADQITIAITVYNRREFVLEAIPSALRQTIPVKVIVVEDCGPDPRLQRQVTSQFGPSIQYFRNSRRRGLFDNWNACMEYCATPWLSILHDDDLLRPCFVEAMLDLAKKAPDRGLYFGRSGILDDQGTVVRPPDVSWKDHWCDIEPAELAERCFLMFPGQLLNIHSARQMGGFRSISYLTGDWDLWFRLVLACGGALSEAEVSIARAHYGPERGTSLVNRKGWTFALDNMQRKRNLKRLREARGTAFAFERTRTLKSHPIPSRFLLRYAAGFSKRLLAYNAWLFVHSTPPHWRYAWLQRTVKLFGPEFLRLSSRLWRRYQRPFRKGSIASSM